jgi:hypothetical protein
MKTTMLNVAAREAGVTVLALAAVEVTLARLAGRSLGALECVRLDPAALGAPLPTRDLRLDLVPLHLKGLARGTAGRRGIVVGASVAQALEFILANWVPSGKVEPDVTLRAAQAGRGPRHARIQALEAALLRKQESEDYGPFERPGRRRRARLRPRFVWTQDEFESSFDAVSAGGRTAYLPSAGTFGGDSEPPRHAAVVERTQVVRGHRVPRWDVLTVGSADNVEAVAWGCRDGRWFRCPFSRLDGRLLEVFEDQGRLVSVVEGDLLASETLEARFLLRVPDSPAPEDPERVGQVPVPLSGLPGALLSDSRCPVHIAGDVQVITDPREAWSVLLRTTSGIFLPDTSPCAPPRSFRQLAGAWIVGSVPAGRVP